jgi:predicted GNAT family N-acyltransferase
MEWWCERVVDEDAMAAVRRVRRSVFIEEQGVPEAEEWDDFDVTAIHFALRTGNRVVGTARLVDRGDGRFKIGRVAVLPETRGQGGGACLMRTAEEHARSLSARVLLLDAQVAVIPFYERLGYEAEGEVFMDAGIPHRRMSRSADSP